MAFDHSMTLSLGSSGQFMRIEMLCFTFHAYSNISIKICLTDRGNVPLGLMMDPLLTRHGAFALVMQSTKIMITCQFGMITLVRLCEKKLSIIVDCSH